MRKKTGKEEREREKRRGERDKTGKGEGKIRDQKQTGFLQQTVVGTTHPVCGRGRWRQVSLLPQLIAWDKGVPT
jgi:hypothetical protein